MQMAENDEFLEINHVHCTLCPITLSRFSNQLFRLYTKRQLRGEIIKSPGVFDFVNQKLIFIQILQLESVEFSNKIGSN